MTTANVTDIDPAAEAQRLLDQYFKGIAQLRSPESMATYSRLADRVTESRMIVELERDARIHFHRMLPDDPAVWQPFNDLSLSLARDWDSLDRQKATDLLNLLDAATAEINRAAKSMRVPVRGGSRKASPDDVAFFCQGIPFFAVVKIAILKHVQRFVERVESEQQPAA